MMGKSFSSPRKWPRGISPLTLGALILIAFAAARLGADSVPDWVSVAARESMPPLPKDPVAVILLDEQITTVRDSGEIDSLYRRVCKILRPEGRDHYGHVIVEFDKDTKLSSLKAWTLPVNGKDYEVKEKDAMETSMFSDSLYSDMKAKLLEIPAATPGNVVAYEYSQKRRPYILDEVWDFQETIPIRRTRFTLQLPPGWEMKTQWANHPEVQEKKTGENSYTWEMENVPAVEVEPEMPPWRVIAGRMGVKYFPTATSPAAKTSGSWKDIALWYAGLTTTSREATPEIKQKVAELTANAPTTLDKIKAITNFMQRQIRYVAIEIGIGGFQPHPASTVFQYKYGDCKDKVTLLSSMLHEIGVESYYVVAQVDRGIIRPDFPSPGSFNHMILAIRLPDNVENGNLYAIVKHPTLGRLLIFDPTDEYTPLGYIPDFEQENYGLLVTPDGGELISLPLLPPITNRLMRSGKLSLTSNGDLTGDVNEVLWGGPAVLRRAQLLGVTPANRSKVIESFLGSHLNNFHLTSATVGNLEQYDQNLMLHYKFIVDSYAKTAGNLLLVRPRVLGSKGPEWDLSIDRKYPVEFNEATVQTDDYEISLPQGYVADDIPTPVDVKSDYGSYRSSIELTGSTLHYQRLYEINKVFVPTQKLPDVRVFFKQIATDERASAVLRKSP
ncbi:MAG: DUF3857 and transglutaminase domain-containing protein [Candidatus Acidiferrales bacterium]